MMPWSVFFFFFFFQKAIGHKACYDLTEEFSHQLFIGRSKYLFGLVESEEWLWESKLYSFAEDFSTAFDNVVCNLTMVQCKLLSLYLHSVLGPI
jgi:hypothetical protein